MGTINMIQSKKRKLGKWIRKALLAIETFNKETEEEGISS